MVHSHAPAPYQSIEDAFDLDSGVWLTGTHDEFKEQQIARS